MSVPVLVRPRLLPLTCKDFCDRYRHRGVDPASIEHYGASADHTTLFREFGITADAVVDAARRSLGRA